jgi:DNA-binding MarR family transcriptional regulator
VHLQQTYPVSYAIYAMARAQRAIAAPRLAELGLFPSQEIMLSHLAACDGLSQADLMQRLQISHVAVAKSARRLETAGLVVRRPSDVDRRMTLVFLTAAGRAMKQNIDAVWSELNTLVTSGLSDADQRAFLRVAAKISAVLTSQ